MSPSSDLRPQQPELVLELRHERPINVGDLSELFGSLARDYRQISRGRELVVVRLSEGSLIAVFRDAAEFAGGINDLVELAKTVAHVLGGALGGVGAAALFRRKKKAGVRTVEALAKIAARSESHMRVRYKGAEGDRLFVEVTPSQGRQVQEVIAEARKPKPSRKTDARAVTELSHAFSRLVERAAVEQEPHSDLEVLLKMLVEVARGNKMDHLLINLAQDLESRGHLATARRLRAMIGSSESTGGMNPPLLT